MRKVLLTACFSVLICASANASVIGVRNAGYYNSTGTAGPNSPVYLTGICCAGSLDHRSWLEFNLTGVTGTITGATLHLFNPSSGFSSSDGSETFAIFDVTSSRIPLITGAGGLSAFNDLGGGVLLGSAVVTAAANGSFVDVTLNASGISYMTSKLGGLAYLGGAITSLSGTADQYVFVNSHLIQYPGSALTLDGATGGGPGGGGAVPIPAVAWLFGGALSALGLVRRKRE